MSNKQIKLPRKVIGALRSKTMWFNFITALLAGVNAATVTVDPMTLLVINVIGNTILRSMTDTSLADK